MELDQSKGIDTILDKQYHYYIIDGNKYYSNKDISVNHDLDRVFNYKTDKEYKKYIKENGKQYLLIHADYFYYWLMKRIKVFSLEKMKLSSMIMG
ncbi:MAG: hypothetical protein AB7V16_12780 [Vulcanibacillus sp.]